jgi:tight adherence protein B
VGAVLGLVAGVGLLLAYSAFAFPRTRSERSLQTRTRSLLRGAGLGDTAPSVVLAASTVAGSVAGAAVQAVSGTPPVALAFAAIAGYAPVGVLRARSRRRQRDLAEVWPEAVDNLASAVRAGLSLPEALSQLAVRGPEPLRRAFAAFAVDYQVTGRFGDCLDRLKERLHDPVGDRVVEGLRIAREVGGGELGRLLRSLSGYLRDDLRTRAELESRQAWAVNGARLAVAAPWMVLLMLSFQTEVITRYSSAAGVVVLVGGGLCCVLAYRLMVRIGRLPRERRVLA